MVKNLIPYLFIGAYLLLTLVIGIIGYRSPKNTPEDYFLAERKISSIVLYLILSFFAPTKANRNRFGTKYEQL